MFRILGLFLAIAVMICLSACESDKPQDPNRVSTIPWNRPETWEGSSVGGMMPGTP
jgi:hypothetical protein